MVPVSGDGQNGTVGQQLPEPLVVRIDDQSGNPMSGVSVSFQVVAGGGTLSSGSATTDASGRANVNWTLGTTAGTQHQARATVPGTNLSRTFGATANPGAPAAITADSGNNQFAYRGTKLPEFLVVRIRDQYANGIPNQLVQFVTDPGNGTPDSAVAFTDGTGRARTRWTLGTIIGEQAARAVVAGVAGSPVTFSATAHNLSIASVVPSPMRLGESVTITGTGFSTNPTANVVTIGGVRASVNTATETQLGVTVPNACLAAGPIDVKVAVAPFTSAPDTNDIVPQSFLQMSVGQQVIVQDPNDFCIQFAEATGTQRYLIGVQSMSENVSDLTPIVLAGRVPLGVPGAAPELALRAAPSGRVPKALFERTSARRLTRHRAAEVALRELDRRNFEILRGQQSLLQRVSPSEAAIDPNAAVGDTVQIRVITESSCAQYADITTVVRAKGTRGIFLEDIANPTPGYSEASFNTLSAKLDDVIYDTEVAYFGTPLDQDNNQRIVVVVTKEVNKRGSLGFTSSCDFFPRGANNPASNEGEYFYQEAPDPGGVHGGEFDAAEALAYAPVILAHELVHVIQFSERIRAGGSFPSIWLFEGQATFAEEVVGFADEGRSPGSGYGFGIMANLDDTLSIDWYSDRMYDLGFYFGWDPDIANDDFDRRLETAPQECSWLALPPTNPGPCFGGRDAYGTPWSLLRWLSDQYGPAYPGGERGFQKDLIHNTLSGYALLEALTQTPIETLLARWAAMLYVDGYNGFDGPGTLGNPTLEMSSWDLYDVYYGDYVAGEWRYWMWEAARLLPNAVPFAPFTRAANVRAGSAYYSIISGTNRPATAVRVRDPDGNPLPGNMQVWVVRLR